MKGMRRDNWVLQRGISGPFGCQGVLCQDTERVAIAGVTGYIGGRLAPRLIEHGYAVRCLVRSPAKLQNRPWATDPKVQIRLADLADETSLTPRVGRMSGSVSTWSIP